MSKNNNNNIIKIMFLIVKTILIQKLNKKLF